MTEQKWKLVPAIPTDDMIVAFAEAWYSKRQAIDDPEMLDAYRDMLAVAPQPAALRDDFDDSLRDMASSACQMALDNGINEDAFLRLARSVRHRIEASRPPALGGESIPDYFQAACDKFDWAPEEALRFYADGKHFDTENGRTRILCTGAIASLALKGIPGKYAEMKGVEAALSRESEVLAVLTLGGVFDNLELGDNDIGLRAEAVEALQEKLVRTTDDVHVELVDRAHVARLQVENVRLRSALKFYADGDHLILADHDEWDTCSGEPINWLHDNAGTASVEDGSLAKQALAEGAK